MERCFGSYEALADDPAVEAVYVATLNPFHTEVYVGSGDHQAVSVLAAGTAAPRYRRCIESASGGPGGPWVRAR